MFQLFLVGHKIRETSSKARDVNLIDMNPESTSLSSSASKSSLSGHTLAAMPTKDESPDQQKTTNTSLTVCPSGMHKNFKKCLVRTQNLIFICRNKTKYISK